MKRKLSVLQIRSELKINGPGTNVLEITNGLIKEEHKVITVSSGGSLISELDELNIKSYIVPELGYGIRSIRNCFSAIIKIRKILIGEKVDIIHSHNLASGLLAKLASLTIKPFGIPNINTVHGTGKEKYLRYFSDKLVTVAEFKRDVLIKSKVKPNKIVTIYNGINLANFDYDKVNCKKFIDEFSVGKNEVLVGILAVMNKNKGYEYLIETVKEITSKYSNVRYVFIGDGPLKEELQKRSIELGISEKIIFTGYRRDIPIILKRIDILTLPSLREIFPISLLEGMSMGSAIIASNVGGIPEMITHDENGILVSPGEVDELTNAIIKLLKAPNLIAKMKTNNILRVKNEFSSEVMVERLVTEYIKLIDKNI